MLRRTRSFDWLLFAIFATYAMLLIVQAQGVVGSVLFLAIIAACLVIVRVIIRATSLQEAVVWVSARPRLAFMLIFIWLTSFVQVGWAVLFGQLHVVEAVGLYLVAMVVFSTVMMLGYLLVSFVGRLLASL
jgi:hypothetical protein